MGRDGGGWRGCVLQKIGGVEAAKGGLPGQAQANMRSPCAEEPGDDGMNRTTGPAVRGRGPAILRNHA